ncbi:hypothetical protein H4683_003901 [Filibacter limicola]|uniref:Uncharacterized protein n=1 Tax=Sporosarcina limicola TaxID=34101 RepID=A0A927ML81_9BACL|nr:hypothetical protein [Sporosarcina limicola]
MGYFLWLNASINTTNVAKAIAIINDSNTDIGTTPFRTGVSRPPLSHLFYYFLHYIIHTLLESPLLKKVGANQYPREPFLIFILIRLAITKKPFDLNILNNLPFFLIIHY